MSVTKKSYERLIKRLEKERDRLREIESGAENLLDACQEGREALERAIDALSELV